MPSKPISPIARWTAEAQKLPSDELRTTVPLHVFLGESVDVARFYKTHYAGVPAKDGQPGRPGLDTAQDERRGLTPTTAEDILSLREATQQAQTLYLLAASPRGAAPMEEAQSLIDELTAVLEWRFDDGVEDARDAQLDAVQTTHADAPESADALASALEDYAGLAAAYKTELDGLGGFDIATIDRARAVAEQLRNRPATPVQLTDEARKALALRNRLGTLLHDRVNAVRSAARFVFRHHPAIIREATSAYERRRRAAARRAALKKAPAQPGPATPQ